MDERLAIAGSGAIACGLAATAARHGKVLLWARSEESAARARTRVEKVCGRLSGEANARHVHVVCDLEALGAASVIVEAVVEDHDIKCAVLREAAAHASGDALLATTTSSLSVAALGEATGRPDRFLGLHVFNPVPRMKLVELVFGDEASRSTRERAARMCRDLGKEPVEVPDLPGFVVNRLLFPYLFSAVDLMVQTGMEPEALDRCMRLGAGHPMGPLALLDFVGLDVAVAIGDEITADVPQRLRDLVAEGALGSKTGRGIATG